MLLVGRGATSGVLLIAAPLRSVASRVAGRVSPRHARGVSRSMIGRGSPVACRTAPTRRLRLSDRRTVHRRPGCACAVTVARMDPEWSRVRTRSQRGAWDRGAATGRRRSWVRGLAICRSRSPSRSAGGCPTCCPARSPSRRTAPAPSRASSASRRSSRKGRTPPAASLGAATLAYTQEGAQRGTPLTTLMRSYRLGHAAAWERVTAMIAATRGRPGAARGRDRTLLSVAVRVRRRGVVSRRGLLQRRARALGAEHGRDPGRDDQHDPRRRTDRRSTRRVAGSATSSTVSTSP